MFSDKIIVDIGLLKKYDRPGPRYTSYPTAPYFHENITQDHYLDHIRAGNSRKEAEPVSLYFHLPFCDTLCYFCGCNMLVTRNTAKIDLYIDYLIKEMELLRPNIAESRPVAQLHWGGGTPSYLSPKQIRHLGNAIRRMFRFTRDAEISVEIDPRGLTREHVEALAEVGFNRCSMGVQDFDEQVQKAVNRLQSEQITRQTVTWARELNFSSVNIDLMYGLPFQTAEKFDRTLKIILDIDPDRLAVFNYAHLPQIIKHQRVIKDETLPGPDEKLRLLKLSIEQLTESGYVYIGMDHFAKPQDELTLAMQAGTLYRNFQGYSTRAGLELFAMGMSSISMLHDLYIQNYKKLDAYFKPLDEGRLPIMRGYELSADDILRREVIKELMCNFRLDKSRIEEKYQIVFDEYFAESLALLPEFEQDGLLKLNNSQITINTHGRLIIRNIAMVFDAYLLKKEGQKPVFSRTV